VLTPDSVLSGRRIAVYKLCLANRKFPKHFGIRYGHAERSALQQRSVAGLFRMNQTVRRQTQ
jgi:hypothetical protein